MYDFCILTPTFNRSKELEMIINQLQGEGEKHGFSVLHCIVDDGSDWRFHPYKTMKSRMASPQYHVVCERNFKNFGRGWFWRTWNALMKMAQGREWRYAIAIPDDHVPCLDFLLRTSGHFESLFRESDKAAVAMNILVQSKKNWKRNRFVDGAFICKREFFDCLNWKLNPVDAAWFDRSGPRKVPYAQRTPASSGVGKQMTDRLAVHQKWRIARVRNVSFLLPMEVHSVMFPPDIFPKRPKAWGLGSSNFIDNGDRSKEFPKGVAR